MGAKTFAVAFIWESPTAAESASKAVESLLDVLEPQKTGISVSRRANLVALELHLDLSLFSRAKLSQLQAKGDQSGGHFVELLRVPEDKREAFRAKFLSPSEGEPETFESFILAAKAVRTYVAALSAQPAVEAPAPAPVLKPRATDSSKPQLRQTARYDVALQVQFNTAAELAREYTTNISKGGLFIRTNLRPPLNSQALLTLALPNGETLRAIVRVVHVLDNSQHGGVGVAFEPGNDAFSSSLEKYLAGIPKPS